MNREYIKNVSINSIAYEDVKVGGITIPLMLVGSNGIYICSDADTDVNDDVKVFNLVKDKFKVPRGNCFLFKFSKDDKEKAGRFYARGEACKMDMEDDIYDAYNTCYGFTSKYMNCGEAVGKSRNAAVAEALKVAV